MQFGPRVYSVLVDVLATKIKPKLPIPNWPSSTMENPFSFLTFWGLSGKSNMGVSNHVYFDSNAKQENTKSHGLKGIKDPLADRGKVDIFENFIQAVRNRKEEHLDAHVYEGHVSSGLACILQTWRKIFFPILWR